MFLKRSLVLMVGVLLFIGFFLLKFHQTDAHLESTFHQQRVDYGVQDTVLTAPESSPPPPAAPAPITPVSTEPTAITVPATDSSAPAPASTDSSATPAPGSAPDSSTIIGPPMPPGASTPDSSGPTPSLSAPMVPDASSSSSPAAPMAPDATAPAPPAPSAPDASVPAPPSPTNPMPAPASPDSAPGTDTNSSPMAPPVSPAPSTLNSPRESSPFLFAAYHPADTAEEVTEVAPAQSAPTGTVATPTAPAPVTATPINRAPVTATVSNINSAAMAKPASAVPSSPASAPSTMSTANPIPAHAVSVGGRAIVLGYHQFTGPGVPSKNIYSMSQDVFESEMKYLHDNGYTVVPLSDVVRFVKHEIGLPPNAVAITIDDGYKSALNYAAPVLKQYNYPWTFFVYPEFITRTEGKGAASWPDLVELGKEGVDVECHSMTHPILTSHTQKFKGSRHVLTPEEYDEFLTNETSGAKAILEHELGKTIRYFAYPYGAYNKTVQDKVVAAGFDAVFTVADNPVHITTDVDSIGRYIITKPVERAFAGYLRQGALGLAEVDPAPGATTSNPRPVISAVLGFIGDPASLETDVRDYGIVRHDFDPQTSTVRMYLPRDLIQPEVLVSIRAKDAQSGQIMVANWHFNYEPAAGAPAATHEPIPVAPEPKGETSETNAPSAPPTAMAAPVSASVNKPAPGPSSKGTTP